MILQIDQPKEGIKIGVDQSLEMGIDLSSPDKIFYLLSQGFYKNPKRAIVQELTSNMIDAYTEANLDIMENPAQIILSEKFLQFTDFGVGIGPDRMENIMSKFFASTKDKRNDMIGAFGLGFKSIFSYANQFTVISTFEGVEREWLFSKETGTISISLISEKDSTDLSGTSFILRLSNSYNEAYQWYNVIKETISYFRGVYFKCTITEYWNRCEEINHVPLIEGNTFYYRGINKNQLQLCLDQVIYLIDWSELDLPSLQFPFALKFSISDGLIPTPSRESLIMSDTTKDIIKMRLRETLEELYSYTSKKPIYLYEYYNSSGSIELVIEDTVINLSRSVNILCNKLGLPSFAPLNPDLVQLNLDNAHVKMFFLSHISISHIIRTDKIAYEKQSGSINAVKRGVIYQDRITPPVAKFLMENYSNLYILKVKDNITLNDTYGYKEMLMLYKIPRSDWRKIIIAWQKEVQNYVDLAQKFDHEEYKKWLSEQPRAIGVRYKKQENEIVVQTFVHKERTDGFKLVKKPIELTTCDWFIYDTERSSKLEPLFREGFNCYIVSKKDLVLLKGRKFIHVDDFYKSQGFRRIVNNTYIYNKIVSASEYSLFPAQYEHLYQKKRTLNNTGYMFYNLTYLDQWTIDFVKRINSKNIKSLISSYSYVSNKSILAKDNKIKRLESEIKKLKQK